MFECRDNRFGRTRTSAVPHVREIAPCDHPGGECTARTEEGVQGVVLGVEVVMLLHLLHEPEGVLGLHRQKALEPQSRYFPPCL